MISSHTLRFTLRQHTPLIHFQHYQHGATLRATEVKPKLDLFVMETLTGKKYHEAKKTFKQISLFPTSEDQQKWKHWIIGRGANDHVALNYKLRIEPASKISVEIINEPKAGGTITKQRESDGRMIKDLGPYPLFFGNLDKDFDDPTEYKMFTFCSDHVVIIESMTPGLLESLFTPDLLCNFFLHTNFGSRQTKGFGSFYISEGDPLYKPPPEKVKYRFSLKHNNYDNDIKKYQTLFEDINLFYNCLRAGINLKKPLRTKGEKVYKNGKPVMEDVFYFKSLLFYFAKHRLRAQWEKKTIKEEFFPANFTYKNKKGEEVIVDGRLDEQQSTRRSNCNPEDEFPLFYCSPDKILIKDILGLSSTESWQSYGETITKTQARVTNGLFTKLADNEIIIQRFKSPITIKPIYNNTKKQFDIYIMLSDIATSINGNSFILERKKGTPKSFGLSIPDSSKLTVADFLFFVFEEKEPSGKFKVEIGNYVESRFSKIPQKVKLTKIFDEVRSNL